MVTLVFLASVLAVDVSTPPPPPPPPDPPAMRSLGYRFGMANTQIDDHDRTLITFGMQGALELIEHRMRAVLDYEFLLMMGEDAAMMSTRGRGHGLRAGLRVTVLQMKIRDIGRLYIDAEGAAGAAYLTDSELGTHVLPNLSAGARIGYELYPQGEESESKMFDAHIMMRALVTQGDVGFVFGVGMEWGR